MAHIAYVNGSYLPHAHATVHIEDRGYQFADGVYEYIAYYNRRLLDMQPHIHRLIRSLGELSIEPPMSPEALQIVMAELIERNSRADGGLYIQITRGVARRDHPFPVGEVRPSLVMTVCAAKTPSPEQITDGVKVITQPDQRWARRDIKSIALLPNILAKQKAASQGCREAWLVTGDKVIEASAANAYIIKDGTLITHPADEHILGGIVREVVLALAKKENIPVDERAFTLDEAYGADEAFLTSTSANVLPVTLIDNKKIGEGRPGNLTERLRVLYNAHVQSQTGKVFS